MGDRLVNFTGPLLSTGSPVTLKTRPRVPSPTGTVMGPPVSFTFMPRFNPSVDDMAIERTQFSPRCCWTSSVSLVGLPLTSYSISRALRSEEHTSELQSHVNIVC